MTLCISLVLIIVLEVKLLNTNAREDLMQLCCLREFTSSIGRIVIHFIAQTQKENNISLTVNIAAAEH